MRWCTLTPTVDDMLSPYPVKHTPGLLCGLVWEQHGHVETVTVFVFAICLGSEYCVHMPPTRTWALRWRTYGDWSTATWGTCTPSLMTRQWWDRVILSLCFVSYSSNTILCHVLKAETETFRLCAVNATILQIQFCNNTIIWTAMLIVWKDSY